MRLICSVRTPPPHAMRACIIIFLRTRLIGFLHRVVRCVYAALGRVTPSCAALRRVWAALRRVASRLPRVCAAFALRLRRICAAFAPRLRHITLRYAALRLPGDSLRGLSLLPWDPVCSHGTLLMTIFLT